MKVVITDAHKPAGIAWMMRVVAALVVVSMWPVDSHAQDDVEYRMEFGAGAGAVSYVGDLNGSITGSLQPMGSLLLRRVISPWMALRANLTYGMLKGKSSAVKTYYPDMANDPYSFSNHLGELGITYEYNFLPYGTGHDYRGAKRVVPFVFLGVGGTLVTGDTKSMVAANFPIGVGVKAKIGDRLNLGLEWAVHFTLSDKLDGVVDPYLIPSSGAFKNKDGYTALQLTLTYSFSPKCVTCHNQDE